MYILSFLYFFERPIKINVRDLFYISLSLPIGNCRYQLAFSFPNSFHKVFSRHSSINHDDVLGSQFIVHFRYQLVRLCLADVEHFCYFSSSYISGFYHFLFLLSLILYHGFLVFLYILYLFIFLISIYLVNQYIFISYKLSFWCIFI